MTKQLPFDKCRGDFASKAMNLPEIDKVPYSASTDMRFKEQRAIRRRRKNSGHFITRLFLNGRPGNYFKIQKEIVSEFA